MNVDFKITTWERVEINEELEKKVLAELQKGKIKSANDLIEFMGEGSSEIIDETSDQMSLTDNKGQRTIDFLDDSGESVYSNEESI
jgi:hypothetical protein